MPASSDRDRVLTRYARHVNTGLASLARLVAAPVEVSAAGSKVHGSDGHTYLVETDDGTTELWRAT